MPSNPGDNKPSTGMRATDVARAGYEGYGEWVHWKSFNGEDMLRWDDLSDKIKMAWVAAAGAITRKILRPTPHPDPEGE